MSAWFGLIASALCFAAIAAWLPASFRNRRINALIALVLSLLPWPGGDSAAMWLHTLLGTPSATLAQLALLTALGVHPRALEKPLLFAFLLIAIEFYVLALGIGQLDVYGIGYRSPMLIVAIFPIGLWLSHSNHRLWLWILSLDLLAYALGVHANLWDALFDPVIVALALISLLKPRPAANAAAR